MRNRKPASDTGRNDTLTANAEISVDGRRIQLNLVVPVNDVPAEAVLPVLHQFSAQVAEGVEEKTLESGKPIACRKGCGACCRQPVPVTRAEARQLAALVDGMPDRERSAARARFQSALKKAQEAGVEDILAGLDDMDDGEMRTVARDYFDQDIACPFLVDESCSIHPVRPLVCREYLVTSSPEHCAKLDGPKIQRLPFPAPIMQTFGRMEGHSSGEKDRFILLITALQWALENPGEGLRRPGPEWIQEFFQELAHSEIPDPSPYL